MTISFFLLLLIPIFTINAPPEYIVASGGITKVIVWITNDTEKYCNNDHSDACLTDMGIITLNPFQETPKGCNVLTHEYFHMSGYSENEIPLCIKSQEFRR